MRRGRSHSVSPDDPVSPVLATLLPRHTGLTVTEQMLLLLQSLHLHKDVLPLLSPEEVVNDANPKLVQMFNNNRDRLVQPASIQFGVSELSEASCILGTIPRDVVAVSFSLQSFLLFLLDILADLV